MTARAVTRAPSPLLRVTPSLAPSPMRASRPGTACAQIQRDVLLPMRIDVGPGAGSHSDCPHLECSCSSPCALVTTAIPLWEGARAAPAASRTDVGQPRTAFAPPRRLQRTRARRTPASRPARVCQRCHCPIFVTQVLVWRSTRRSWRSLAEFPSRRRRFSPSVLRSGSCGALQPLPGRPARRRRSRGCVLDKKLQRISLSLTPTHAHAHAARPWGPRAPRAACAIECARGQTHQLTGAYFVGLPRRTRMTRLRGFAFAAAPRCAGTGWTDGAWSRGCDRSNSNSGCRSLFRTRSSSVHGRRGQEGSRGAYVVSVDCAAAAFCEDAVRGAIGWARGAWL
ncbi:hypothetical protein C8Q78DRAFT_488774 [Trametes maxima]|nr:hypothetical protein C8Q78DRAFT_488774 [Trametes maxima]